MTITVTPGLLRDLATFRGRNRCAISLYLDLDPSVAATVPDADAKFRARLSEAEKLAESTAAERDCRLAVRDDLARIRGWWDEEFDRDGVHGVAVFASGADGYFLALPLSARVPDMTSLGEELRLAPLVGRFVDVGTLVAVVSREQGRVYRLRDGLLDEVLDESEEQPGQHDQGGWSQARYQRHIENLVQQHLKAVGGALDRRARNGSAVQLVVVCPEEMRGTFAATLSQEARDAIVGWCTAESHASPAELRQLIRPLLDEADARRRQDALARFENGLGRERACTGWQPTLDAAADTRVELLLVTEGADRAVFQCPECRRGYVDDGTCPIDDLALVKRDDGAEVAIHHVLANGGHAMSVGPGALGGEDVGALLRF
jgi:peptide chain release factor subunit 1